MYTEITKIQRLLKADLWLFSTIYKSFMINDSKNNTPTNRTCQFFLIRMSLAKMWQEPTSKKRRKCDIARKSNYWRPVRLLDIAKGSCATNDNVLYNLCHEQTHKVWRKIADKSVQNANRNVERIHHLQNFSRFIDVLRFCGLFQHKQKHFEKKWSGSLSLSFLQRIGELAMTLFFPHRNNNWLQLIRFGLSGAWACFERERSENTTAKKTKLKSPVDHLQALVKLKRLKRCDYCSYNGTNNKWCRR